MINKFVQDIINGGGGWKVFEDREIVTTPDRDVAIASWTVRCLGNASNPDALEVVKQLAKRHGYQLEQLPPEPNDEISKNGDVIDIDDAMKALGEDEGGA